MTDERNEDENGDERHDFESGTLSATDDHIADNEGHRFEKGRLAPQDEADEK